MNRVGFAYFLCDSARGEPRAYIDGYLNRIAARYDDVTSPDNSDRLYDFSSWVRATWCS